MVLSEISRVSIFLRRSQSMPHWIYPPSKRIMRYYEASRIDDERLISTLLAGVHTAPASNWINILSAKSSCTMSTNVENSDRCVLSKEKNGVRRQLEFLHLYGVWFMNAVLAVFATKASLRIIAAVIVVLVVSLFVAIFRAEGIAFQHCHSPLGQTPAPCVAHRSHAAHRTDGVFWLSKLIAHLIVVAVIRERHFQQVRSSPIFNEIFWRCVDHCAPWWWMNGYDIVGTILLYDDFIFVGWWNRLREIQINGYTIF